MIQRFQAVFYRTDHLTTDKANVISAAGPWNFTGITTIDLDVEIDGGGVQPITLQSSLLADITAGTAAELVVQINTSLTGGLAVEDSEGRIIIVTNRIGDAGSVTVGGDAGSFLRFSSETAEGSVYDDVFGAPTPQSDGTQEGQETRRELAPVTIECQLDRADWGTRKLTAGGEEEKADGILTLKKDDLDSASLMGSDGSPMLHIGDRLDKILQIDGDVAIDFPNPPGMWVQKVETAGFGLAYFGTPEVNLFYIHCSKDRTVEST